MKTNLSEVEKEIWVIAYKRALSFHEPSNASALADEALKIYHESVGFGSDDKVQPQSRILGWPGLIMYDKELFFIKPSG
ncbi:hypothetical protein E4A48_05540 [Xanthomonas cerealis pv. cerealis]|uniref:Uncharacterized protein n=1 Tax=Xanthomonas cerealis pv. cerealis TaxID=152263 RepID=A0A514EB09_9XANT|nr:hypothetical protein [Xanthomonas translucens]QDI03230.1 hypothetical protein E4A48_05540 [Xanthomonas translucens pv. cerealis]